jgi:hypothetical protein
MKRVLFYLSFLTVIFATSCEIIDESSLDFTPDQPDASGNLLIINNSNEQLVLYKDQVVIKKIPASATDFLVYIANESEGTVQLDLYRWEDVAADVSNPDPALAFKRWLVPLANGTSVSDRATWHIGSDDTFIDVATANFSYFGGTSYFVDIFLNDRTGAKIMSMMPGQQYKKVGIDYGNYTLHYKYWYSNQNDNQAIDESKTTWVETETINGDEVNIWMVLNENRNDVTYIVPHNGIDTQKKSWYGNIKITNMHNIPVLISAGDKLIENVCYLDNISKTNYSSIASLGSTTYVMPILSDDPMEETYILTARDVEGRYVEDISITVLPDETYEWIVDGEADVVEADTTGM